MTSYHSLHTLMILILSVLLEPQKAKSLEFLTQISVNNICHSKGIAFWAADMAGTYGYIFCDLDKHHYVSEQKQSIKGLPETLIVTDGIALFQRFESMFEKTFAEKKRWKRKNHELFIFFSCV
jgi:hypothetical protein